MGTLTCAFANSLSDRSFYREVRFLLHKTEWRIVSFAPDLSDDLGSIQTCKSVSASHTNWLLETDQGTDSRTNSKSVLKPV